jgi:hypothetical protein
MLPKAITDSDSGPYTVTSISKTVDTPDEPPDPADTQGCAYSITSQLFWDDDQQQTNAQVWLYDDTTQKLLITDQFIYTNADDINMFGPSLVNSVLGFIPVYTVTVSILEDESVVPHTPSNVYKYHGVSTTSFKAAPNVGWYFQGWRVNGAQHLDTSNPLTLTLNTTNYKGETTPDDPWATKVSLKVECLFTNNPNQSAAPLALAGNKKTAPKGNNIYIAAPDTTEDVQANGAWFWVFTTSGVEGTNGEVRRKPVPAGAGVLPPVGNAATSGGEGTNAGAAPQTEATSKTGNAAESGEKGTNAGAAPQAGTTPQANNAPPPLPAGSASSPAGAPWGIAMNGRTFIPNVKAGTKVTVWAMNENGLKPPASLTYIDSQVDVNLSLELAKDRKRYAHWQGDGVDGSSEERGYHWVASFVMPDCDVQVNPWEAARQVTVFTKLGWYLGVGWAPFVHLSGGDAYLSRDATLISFALTGGLVPFNFRGGSIGFNLDIDYARLSGNAEFNGSSDNPTLASMDAHLASFGLNVFYRTPRFNVPFSLNVALGGGLALGFGWTTSKGATTVPTGIKLFPFVNTGLLLEPVQVGHFSLGIGADFRLLFMEGFSFVMYIVPRLSLNWRF